MESTKETAAPEGPILCVNNCGFFGSAATMNMCSKCHREMILKQENAKLAASSIDDIINGSGSGKDEAAADVIKPTATQSAAPVELNVVPVQACSADSSSQVPEVKVGPSRCSTCRKRVGLTGFNCKCGNLFCSAHHYSDKHECPFDYRGAGRDAIAKANPVVKAEKLDKI
ncbi:zinc finger A20 and AN1 domain-containing stress-associated protein 4-like [Bidens hawaiensis]|uniref:zinc finger A20 and AN1 domain-containing stress-associated protein 4-like n=1 Tax=Bidens hawaiensis TaxID=980011 RepID=UPI00404974A3